MLSIMNNLVKELLKYFMFMYFYFMSFFVKKKFKMNVKNQYYEDLRKNIDNLVEKCNNSDNVDSVFYNKEKLESILTEENNNIESKWKRNVLLKSIQREDGKHMNIIMFFDAYKYGFAYYCDESFISHEVLNMIALKYCLTFCCSYFYDKNNKYIHLGKICNFQFLHNRVKSKGFETNYEIFKKVSYKDFKNNK